MVDIPHNIKYKKSKRISQWKTKCGLKLEGNQTYGEIYDKVQNTLNCELCQIELCDGLKTNGRTMDHCHESGFFRMVLCRKCNAGHKRELQLDNKTGIRGIHKFENGWRYQPKKRDGYTKYSTNKSIVMWAKFI